MWRSALCRTARSDEPSVRLPHICGWLWVVCAVVQCLYRQASTCIAESTDRRTAAMPAARNRPTRQRWYSAGRFFLQWPASRRGCFQRNALYMHTPIYVLSLAIAHSQIGCHMQHSAEPPSTTGYTAGTAAEAAGDTPGEQEEAEEEPAGEASAPAQGVPKAAAAPAQGVPKAAAKAAAPAEGVREAAAKAKATPAAAGQGVPEAAAKAKAPAQGVPKAATKAAAKPKAATKTAAKPKAAPNAVRHRLHKAAGTKLASKRAVTQTAKADAKKKPKAKVAKGKAPSSPASSLATTTHSGSAAASSASTAASSGSAAASSSTPPPAAGDVPMAPDTPFTLHEYLCDNCDMHFPFKKVAIKAKGQGTWICVGCQQKRVLMSKHKVTLPPTLSEDEKRAFFRDTPNKKQALILQSRMLMKKWKAQETKTEKVEVWKTLAWWTDVNKSEEEEFLREAYTDPEKNIRWEPGEGWVYRGYINQKTTTATEGQSQAETLEALFQKQKVKSASAAAIEACIAKMHGDKKRAVAPHAYVLTNGFS